MNDIQPLTNLQCGQTARVGKLTLQGSMRRRLQDIGLIEGTQVECVQKSPAGAARRGSGAKLRDKMQLRQKFFRNRKSIV